MKMNELSTVGKVAAIATVLLVLLLILLLLAETAVRVRSYLKTGMWWGVEQTFVVDEASGLRIPRPSLDTGVITINSAGFRGPEIAQTKPPGTIRLAFLGASTTYCAEVSGNEMAWPHLVTESLKARYPEHDFDFINGGTPGYSVDHSLENLNKRIARYAPDVIVIYHATNDLSFNSFQAALEAGVATQRADNEKFWLSRYSLLSHLVELSWKVRRLQTTPAGDMKKLDADPQALAVPFAEDLAALVARAREVAPMVAIATFSVQYRREQPPEQQVRAASTSLYYMPYMTVEGLLDSFDAYNAVIRDVAHSAGILLIDGEQQIPGDAVHFNDSVHFKDAGSKAMAARVTDALTADAGWQRLLETTSP